MYDILVIGGGPAGVTAALRARELNASVALVERGRMGGTCTNDGCVPTRALAKTARLVRDAAQFRHYGLIGDVPQVDFPQVLARAQEIVDQIHEKKQLIDNLRQAEVTLHADVGPARFVDPHTVELPDGTRLQGERILICAGGHARRLPFPGSEHALTHSDVWTMTRLPRSVAVIGAAATGCQLASIFEAFGAQVHLLDAAPRLLPGEDEAVSREMAAAFERRGMLIQIGIGGIERLERHGDGLRLVYTRDGQPQSLDVEATIMAVGWPGNLESLNLEAAGVRTERNYIVVDDRLQTSVPHIFAAGDINGRLMLVQSGSYDARIAAENALLEGDRAYQHQIVPHGGFTDPEYGCVGLSEAQAAESHEYAVATVPYAATDRAVIDGYTEGFCKLIVSRETHELLGASVVGEQAVEVVQIVAAGMAAGMRVEQLAELELAYPTYAAIVGLAARQLGRELGSVQLAPQWRTLRGPRMAEWERSRVG